MEQVRAETEQWSQMQEMLGQVREEMEELQASRDFWEKRALESSCKIDTLNFEVRLRNVFQVDMGKQTCNEFLVLT